MLVVFVCGPCGNQMLVPVPDSPVKDGEESVEDLTCGNPDCQEKYRVDFNDKVIIRESNGQVQRQYGIHRR